MLIFPEKILFQKIENEITYLHKIDLYVLRLDAIDYYAGGNKLFKLKYNLEEAQKQGFNKILTFGGAWSNHLAAFAAINQEKDVRFIAVIRGEEPRIYSDTLRFCKEKGVELHFISREDYRRKTEPVFIDELKNKFGDFYLLPEGGSNTMAIKGCAEIINYVPVDFDYICCPVGSGGTMAGIVSVLKPHQQALGFSALKGVNDLESKIESLLNFKLQPKNFKIIHDYHFGGFAKINSQLTDFKISFKKEFGFELDYIYTTKMFYGIFDLIQRNYFKKGARLTALHTGGLQGNKGFEK